MRGSGKASTAIVAALAQPGRKDVDGLMFTADTDRDEDTYTRERCSTLGLKHETVLLRQMLRGVSVFRLAES